MRLIKAALAKLADPFIALLVLPCAYLFKFFRKHTDKLPITKKTLFHVGVFPIRDHYYEPMFNPKYLRHSLKDDRTLPGINFNDAKQLELLHAQVQALTHYRSRLRNVHTHDQQRSEGEQQVMPSCLEDTDRAIFTEL